MPSDVAATTQRRWRRDESAAAETPSSRLSTQVAVLQLREQLHPAVLGQWVRPHEPRPDLLAALLAEPAQQHARRLLTSLLIYAGLLFVLVAAPVHLLAPLAAPLASCGGDAPSWPALPTHQPNGQQSGP